MHLAPGVLRLQAGPDVVLPVIWGILTIQRRECKELTVLNSAKSGSLLPEASC